MKSTSTGSIDQNKQNSILLEIKHMLLNHEQRISKLEKNTDVVKTQKNQSMGSENALSDLLDDSFFNEPKTFGQIIKQLKTNAIFSNNADYKEILANFVKDKKLRRKISHHQWVYFKNG